MSKRLNGRVTRLQKQLDVSKEKLIVAITNYSVDFIKAGYFRDAKEKQTFLEWRMERLKEEFAADPSDRIVYVFEEEDVKRYIQRFQATLQTIRETPRRNCILQAVPGNFSVSVEEKNNVSGIISITEFRKILGTEEKSFSDEQINKLISLQEKFVDVIFNKWAGQRNHNKKFSPTVSSFPPAKM